MIDVSVVIVNYNVKYFLEICLLAVKRASLNLNVEVLVVDNNSHDGSCEYISTRFPEVKIIANKDNPGFSKANNQAIRQAKGKYVLILNPDTIIAEDTLEQCFQFMEINEKAGALGVPMFDGTGQYLRESKRALPTPMVSFFKIFGFASLFPNSRVFARYHLGYLDKNKTHQVDILSGAFMFMRKQTLDKIGLFDEDYFMYGEDIDLSYRVILGGYQNYYFAGTSIIHFKGESTKKGSLNYVVVFYKAMEIFARKHFTHHWTSPYHLVINGAIWLRACMAILKRASDLFWHPLTSFFSLLTKRPVDIKIQVLLVGSSDAVKRFRTMICSHEDSNWFMDDFIVDAEFDKSQLLDCCMSTPFHKVVFLLDQLPCKDLIAATQMLHQKGIEIKMMAPESIVCVGNTK